MKMIDGDRERHPGPLEHLVADAPPDALAGDGRPLGVERDRAAARPEALAAEDREQRRQQGEAGEHAGEDADRRDRPEGGRELRVGERERQHRQRDGQPRRQDRRAGTAHGPRHRVVLVLDQVELLAVSRDEQQAVVGGYPEHQDDQDRGAVRGHRRARLGVEVDERGRDRVGEEDDHERGQRDQHRAVDHAEQEQHQQGARDQELGVEVGEDLLGVGREAEVAGDEDPHPVGLVADEVADVLRPSRRPSRSRWGRSGW